jgi:hypothetical protein
MNLKRSAVALVAAGGTAAVLFGGSAVSTDFTQQQTGAISVNTTTMRTQLTGGTITLDDAIPGDSKTQQVTFKNEGTRKVRLTVKSTLSGSSALAGLVTLSSSAAPGHSITLSQAVGSLGSLDVNPGQTISFPLTVTLDKSAGNDVQGKSAAVNYTLTATAVA